MIEDKELRDLFKVESAEHLQALEKGLLRLEKEPGDKATLDEVFREAHSLKGAARMVGVSGVETIAHKLEDILGSAKKGEAVLTSETIDRLYKGLDSMKKLVNEAVTGEAAGVNISEVIAQISGEDKSQPDLLAPSTSSGRTEKEKTVHAEPVEAQPQPEIPPSPPLSKGGEGGIWAPSEFRIETVRVDTKILDMLMTQAGELTVTKTHISRHVAEMEDISEAWEAVENKVGAYGDTPLQSKIHNLKSKMSDDSARLDFIASKLEDGIRTIRLIPLSTIFSLYPRMVRDMAKGQSKEVELVIEGGDTAADKRIIEEMKDPVMHMIRNSIDHGIETPAERERLGKQRSGKVTLKGYQAASNIVIEVSDDGKGMDIEAIRQAALKRKIHTEGELAAMTADQIQSLVFASGFSTSTFVTDVSGRGVGLDVVRANVERLKGTVAVESIPGAGCRFTVRLPVTLATVRVLFVGVGGRTYAIPVENIETSRMVSTDEIFPIAGRMTINFDGEPVSVAMLAELLEIQLLPSPSLIKRGSEGAFPCIILSVNKERLGLLVDSLIDEQTVIMKPQSAILKHVRNVSGATILVTGEVCMVLNPHDLLKSIQTHPHPAEGEGIETQNLASLQEVKGEGGAKKSILLVEDSITTRTQEKRILEGAGYEVVAAVNGVDGWTRLQSGSFDAVVTDIVMPEMDGLSLTAKIRQDKRYKEMPVILVTTLASDEDKRKGLEAGANAYIPKPAFDQKMFLETLRRLI
ncbi:MAG: hybrid sensor histidine kinase/response regulator [Deltaproteobacteria bacterium]